MNHRSRRIRIDRMKGLEWGLPTPGPLSIADALGFPIALVFYVAGIIGATLMGLCLLAALLGLSGRPAGREGVAVAILAGLAMGSTYWSTKALKSMIRRIEPGPASTPLAAEAWSPGGPLYDRELDR